MKFLPRWCLSNLRPTIYDAESGSVIEQTAKVYGAMNELIEEYNKFADSWNEKIEQFINKTLEDEEAFRVALRQEFQDFINVVELKIMELDNYAKNEVATQLNNMFKQILEGDELKAIVRDELSSMSTAISELTDEMNTRLSGLSSEISSSASTLRGEINSTASTLRGEMNSSASTLKGDIESTLRGEMNTTHESLSTELVGRISALRNEVNALITSNTNAINNILSDVNKILDFITEKGVSGAWNYRKYNSGVVECWGSVNAVVTANYIEDYAGYEDPLFSNVVCKLNLPDVVTEVTSVTFTSKDANLFALYSYTNIMPTAHAVALGLKGNSTTAETYVKDVEVPISVHLFGKWK